jgi:hypothetical protein
MSFFKYLGSFNAGLSRSNARSSFELTCRQRKDEDPRV